MSFWKKGDILPRPQCVKSENTMWISKPVTLQSPLRDYKQFLFAGIFFHIYNENRGSSYCQLCPHWWYRGLSERQPTMLQVTTKLALWQLLVSVRFAIINFPNCIKYGIYPDPRCLALYIYSAYLRKLVLGADNPSRRPVNMGAIFGKYHNISWRMKLLFGVSIPHGRPLNNKLHVWYMPQRLTHVS